MLSTRGHDVVPGLGADQIAIEPAATTNACLGESQLDAAFIQVDELVGGLSSAVHRLRLAGRQAVVLRRLPAALRYLHRDVRASWPFPTHAWNALGRTDLTSELVASRIDAWPWHVL